MEAFFLSLFFGSLRSFSLMRVHVSLQRVLDGGVQCFVLLRGEQRDRSVKFWIDAHVKLALVGFRRTAANIFAESQIMINGIVECALDAVDIGTFEGHGIDNALYFSAEQLRMYIVSDFCYIPFIFQNVFTHKFSLLICNCIWVFSVKKSTFN